MSHEKTITIGVDGKFYNVPTVVGGKQLSDKAATEHAFRNKKFGRGYGSQKEAVGAARTRSKAADKASTRVPGKKKASKKPTVKRSLK